MTNPVSTSETLDCILSHRSIRRFKPEPIDVDIIHKLVDAARFASTSNHLQCVSIIRVTDPQLREQLMTYCSNQEYVKSAPEFWVFCVDFQKHKQICPQAQLDYIEVLQIGAVDTGIMAQNVLLGAESLGLGGVFIGSLRNAMAEAGELLKLPQHTLPMLGLCLGYPDQDPPLKPRLPQDSLFFENEYRPLDESILAQYNAEVADYYRERSGIDMDWSRNVIKSLARPVRPQVLDYLHKQGFAKK
ncbi:oxygen-insensitive NADPH nitroreductase [Caviibacterium pharyngocola]|uniref:Oxygen-insensitive NADPH nitroreductase n=1 Tax=Caviibacterium pharyngocola TaxID=28159 RepID=A0A2M8RWZ7_9PAST|nr:oxygen-insensitive NADPH nitroreductase [Caviibacterium pharyngocola]PJG83403.1 oxygen-insensitive NADPH nitroreductase [Caviibacterium pharyngocola]